jgi:hypothetical protein
MTSITVNLQQDVVRNVGFIPFSLRTIGVPSEKFFIPMDLWFTSVMTGTAGDFRMRFIVGVDALAFLSEGFVAVGACRRGVV